MSTPENQTATLEFVTSLEAATSTGDAGDLFLRYVEGYGLSSAACLVVPEFSQASDTLCFFHSFPAEFVEQLLSTPHLKIDAAIDAILQSQKIFRLDELKKHLPSSTEQQSLLDTATMLGFSDGFIIPVVESDAVVGIVALAGPRLTITREEELLLKLVSVFFYTKICLLKRRELRDELDLTTREFECIKWVAVGKTDWEIGQILSISPKTVNYHIENAKRKFAVPSRVQAVVAAIMSGSVKS